MKNLIIAVIMSGAVGVFPLMAQEKKDMPMKQGMPMKGEGMQGGGMMMDKMKDMQGHMGEMRKGMGSMMKGQGMMKSEEMKGMGKGMGDMSGMMSEMGQMMGDMSGMMKQMSERMGRGTQKTQ